MNFDLELDRSRSCSLKWDHYKGTNIEPFWVADMDFAVSDEITSALQERVSHPSFGYTLPPDQLNEVVVNRLDSQYGWSIQSEWIVWLPGIVPALEVCCRAFGGDGGDVIGFTPIYPPFLSAPRNNGQNALTVPLIETDSGWKINFNLFEKSITSKTNLVLFCNPQNPTGRVYDRTELKLFCDICEKHNLVICSDEIHCELILEDGIKHVPTATISRFSSLNCITLMAPSKTFNIAGLSCAFAVIPHSELRTQFVVAKDGIVPYVNTLGYTAALAAYKDSSQWHTELLFYLRGNRDVLENIINSIQGLKVSHVEATYLAWIDCRALDVVDPVTFFEAVNVGLSDGAHFDLHGFVRFNFACTRARMISAIERMSTAVSNLSKQ